ncbi:MAG: SpoIIE family protein phosphatase [Novosphingobium sp.]|nr:SpoIIE family protein phosphatase [Novosphingobium sp.]
MTAGGETGHGAGGAAGRGARRGAGPGAGEATDGAERASGRRGLGLKPQLLALLFMLNLVAAAAYSSVIYNTNRTEFMAGVDARLLAATHAAQEIIPDRYHEAITGPQSIPKAEFDALQARLSRFANRSGFVYVYTYMKLGNQIRTVATSATDQEIAAGRQTPFFALYDTAPRKLFESFADGRTRFDEYNDSFGRFRSIYRPVRMADGRVYVVGADVDLAHLAKRQAEVLTKAILIGVGMFTLSMALGWLLVARIVDPLVRLTSFTKNMERRSFQPDVSEMAAMRKISGSRGDEVGRLAEAMAAMIARLQRYLVEVEAATAARERVEGELSAARDIQIGMLPRKFPPFPERTDLDVFAMLESAKQVGGDLYDYFMIDENRLFFVVGDVSGKGVPAALFMAMTAIRFKAHAFSAASTGEIMELVNTSLSRENPAEMFVTAFAAILDLRDGTVEYTDGGHEAPFLIRADGRVDRLAKHQGMALGVFEDVPYKTDRFTLAPGDAIVLFTDGVSEATDKDDQLFSVERIGDALAQARASSSARLIADGLAESVRGFVGTVPQSDDIAILVVCYEPAPAG